ncbi:MAG: A/G-specific adenine glycosylase, partial [Duodenibacillus sp.]
MTEECLAHLAASGVDGCSFSRTLTEWQKTQGRQDLPWQVSDPYRRWVSEIMLQQTQVPVVQDYFARFLQRFPTVDDLAKADEDAVMELWQGLGYYRRARYLHAAARKIVEDFGGIFPTTPEKLAELPGVGQSTANAIASFCFGVSAPVVDGNVMRLLARVLNLPFEVDSVQGSKALWHAA